MKRICFSLFLAFVPFVSMSADAPNVDRCTSLFGYTIDRRCYVTDEQKKKSPYNSVVALVDDKGDAYCTGTVLEVKNSDVPYMRTAKHCVIDSFNNVEKQVKIRGVSGRQYTAELVEAGNYYTHGNDEKNLLGDWAIYKINGKYHDGMVGRTFYIGGGMYFNLLKIEYEARLVGYGCLKIMSDSDISNFKRAYINYLEKEFPEYKQSSENTEIAGIVEDGIDLDNAVVRNFLFFQNKNNSILNENDCNRLKESVCGFTSGGERVACQSWGGNSGGPVFDKQNRLMATLTRGTYIIGGPNHADGDGHMSEDCSVSHLRGAGCTQFFKPISEPFTVSE